ncbi:MAG TPA: hypothetical protein DIW27_09980 [Cytophagales bacterium]|nr:hypothetical protein [Cytophagales bacterium]
MKLKNNELGKKEVLINRMRLENQLEKLLEEMDKQLIVNMPLMILCMLKIKELKKMLKAMVLFFVLQLLEIVLAMHKHLNILNINTLVRYLPGFQFSVSGSVFSVLIPASGKFNSLYPSPESQKRKNNGKNII